MSRSLYWVLAPVIVITAVALPLLVETWTLNAAVVMIGLEVFMIGLLIGLWDPFRFEWALRVVGGVVFLAYVVYLISMIWQGTWWSGRRSGASAVNAIAGLLIWGLPAFVFMLLGFSRFMGRTSMVFASSNPHKVEEVRATLAPLGIDVIGLDALPADEEAPPEPAEDGETFEANARLKAVYYAQHLGVWCLADDSGLEVDALGGAPGVRSARYADDESYERGDSEAANDEGRRGDRRKTRVAVTTRAERDAVNNAKLLRELKGVAAEQRTARFVCAMCLADSQGNVLAETRGTFEGVIADEARGTNGFGYDPLLYLPDVGCTSAELSPVQKNARSHRGEAARKMAEQIRTIL